MSILDLFRSLRSPRTAADCHAARVLIHERLAEAREERRLAGIERSTALERLDADALPKIDKRIAALEQLIRDLPAAERAMDRRVRELARVEAERDAAKLLSDVAGAAAKVARAHEALRRAHAQLVESTQACGQAWGLVPRDKLPDADPEVVARVNTALRSMPGNFNFTLPRRPTPRPVPSGSGGPVGEVHVEDAGGGRRVISTLRNRRAS